ncbi:MAG: phosphatase PAP2 family protein [Candidatus Lokiarchaeota archaeon]|nr:phosphatase PAP2 family protein [Candidatus Lokiarchaeota archaeon]
MRIMEEYEDLTIKRYKSKINLAIIFGLFSFILILFITILVVTDPTIVIFLNPTVLQTANPIVFFWNVLFVIVSDVLSYSYIVVIIVLFFLSYVPDKRLEFLKKYRFILFIACITGFLTQITVNTLKVVIQRPRPYITYSDLIHLFSHLSDSHSFPSGHTASAFGFLLPIILFQDKTWKKMSILVIPLAVGFSRVYLGVHYLSDVLGGMLLGVCFSIIISLLIFKSKDIKSEKIFKFGNYELPYKQFIYLLVAGFLLVIFLATEILLG